jgi:hypothetical protein
VDFVLAEGLTFRGSGPTISFSANVSNKGYTFELMFKLGDMPDLKDVHSANKQADEKIKELYKLVKDNRIRSMDDAKQIQEELSKVMKPLKKSVESMKKLDKKKFGFEVGVTITGEFPSGGRAPPPTAGFGIKIIF